MLKLRSFFKGSRLLLLTFSLSFLALISITAWSSRAKQDEKQRTTHEVGMQERRENLRAKGLRIENKTRGLTIVSVEQRPEIIEVVLRNDYSKTITGYKAAIGKGRIGTELFASEDESNFLQPGAERREFYPYQVGIETEGIAILAVIFEDRTTDGDPNYAREIQQYRLGRKMQREHALHLLRNIVKVPPTEISSAIARMRSEISPLSEAEENKLPVHVYFGLQDERGVILRKVQHLQGIETEALQDGKSVGSENNSLKVRNKFSTLMEGYARTIKKL